MARDHGLEELLRESLGDEPDLAETSMFGGRAWLLHGNLLCAASDKGLLIRLGKGNDRWALELDGIAPMVMRGRPMDGWLRIEPEVFGNGLLRARLLGAALSFVRALPAK